MKRFCRILCLLLCLMLLPLAAPAESEDSPAPDVRVLLRRLGLTDRADLTLDGSYTAAMNGKVQMSFPRGAQVTVQIRSGIPP